MKPISKETGQACTDIGTASRPNDSASAYAVVTATRSESALLRCGRSRVSLRRESWSTHQRSYGHGERDKGDRQEDESRREAPSNEER